MVRIVTDSVSDLEPEEFERLGVTCIPVFVRFGDREYRETAELSKDTFYQLLTGEKDFPRTSQPAPDSFINAFKAAMEAGDDTVAIFMSARFGGICQGAATAKALLGYENCHIIDSQCAAGGERLLVEHAVKLRDEGKTALEIAQSVEALKSRVQILACPDTLEFLRRGGRIPTLMAAFGSVAGVKPILHIAKDGEVEVAAKTIGKQRGMAYMLRRIGIQKPDPAFPLYVLYTHVRENARALAEKLRQVGYAIGEEQLINVGAGMGSHIGPNAFGVAYIEEVTP